MRRLSTVAFMLCALALPSVGRALTIDITLAVSSSAPNTVTYLVGIANADGGSAVAINGYTLDYAFDASELSFVGAQQLAPFGLLGTLPFSALGDCTHGRCTAGNVPGYDSSPLGDLFAVTFAIVSAIDDGANDFSAGLLDTRFDDVTQPTAQSVFSKGVSVVNAGVPVPEPSAFITLAVVLSSIVARRRVSK